MVLEGLSPAAWAAEINTHPEEVSGILVGSLGYLAKIYADLDPTMTEPARRAVLRTWTGGARSGLEDEEA
jgi:hypothetical protein